MTRIAIIAHSHPSIAAGGGELAAHRFFEYLRDNGADAYFLGLAIGPGDGAGFRSRSRRPFLFGRNDFCLLGKGMDAFLMEHQEIGEEDRLLDLLLSLKADIYHFHHYWNLGAGVIRRLRAARPDAKLICTLHEYAAICANHGQMVKTFNGALCYEATPLACAECHPERGPIDFLIRRHRLLEMFERFDALVSPSEFLRERYETWGVPKGRIEVLENGADISAAFAPETEEELAAKSHRFAFFGKATHTKGLNIVVEAAGILEKNAELDRLEIGLHGATADTFTELWPGIRIPPALRFHGPYAAAQSVALMQGYGWVLVPSTWWENSPLILQEARAARTPVIASDIGGLREKAEDFGVLFKAGSAASLAKTIAQLAGDTGRLAAHKARIRPPFGMAEYTARWQEIAGVGLLPAGEPADFDEVRTRETKMG